MSIYIAIYFILFLFTLLERIDDEGEISGKLTRKSLYALVCFGLVLFAALRYESGFDYYNYKVIYDGFEGFNQTSRYEPGFNLLMYFCKHILGFSYPTFLFILTASSLIVKFSFFQKYFKYPVFLILLYFPPVFMFTDFGQIRQGMALGIFLWAIPAIKNQQLLRFLIIYILGVSFHYSSLIWLPLYWLHKITVTKNFFWTVFFLAFLVNVLSLINLVFSVLTAVLGGFLGNLLRYMMYYGENTLFSFLNFNTLLVLLFIPLYQHLYQHEIKTRTEKDLEFSAYNVYILFFLMIKMLNSITVISYRGILFSKMIEGIIFYYLFTKLKENEYKMLFLLLLFLYGFVRLLFSLHAEAYQYIPYQMFTEFLGF